MVHRKAGDGDAPRPRAVRKEDQRPTAVGLRQLTDQVLELAKRVEGEEDAESDATSSEGRGTEAPRTLDCCGQLPQRKRA